MSKLQGIISEIKALTVIELAELVNSLQEEFGVTASSMAAPAAGSSQENSKTEAKTSFKVELIDSGSEKTKVIKAIRAIKKEMGLIEAKNATENLPFVVLVDANKEDTDNAKKILEEAGAKVKVS
jgi:large subunit ribosomal protein L7/L12